MHREDKGLDIPKYHSSKTFFFYFFFELLSGPFWFSLTAKSWHCWPSIFRSWIKMLPSQSGLAAARKFSTAWFPWSGVLQIFLMLQGSEQSQGAESTWGDEMQSGASFLLLGQASCCRRPACSESKVCIIKVCTEQVFGQLMPNSSSFTLSEQVVWKMSFPPHLYPK